MASLKKNFLYQSIWQVLIMVLPLITSPYLSRVIGASGLGIYSLTYSVISYFVLFANLGIEKYGNREIAKSRNDREKRSKTFCEIYYFHFLITLFVLIIYFIYVFMWAKYKKYAMIQSIYLFAALTSFSWLYAGMEDFKKIVLRDSVIKLLIVSSIFLFVRGKDDLTIYISIMAASSILSSIVLWCSMKTYVDMRSVRFTDIIKHIKPMLVLFIPVALENIYAYMDRIMLGIQNSIEEVGYYDNSAKTMISKTIVFSLGTVMMPRISSLFADNQHNKIKDYLVKSTGLVMILSVAFAFGTAAISFEFAPVFWGKGFEKCSWIILIMAFSLPFQCLSNEIRTHYLIPISKDKEYMFSAAIGTVFNFICNLVMIPYWGAIGAAFASLLSEAIVLFSQLFICRKEFPFLKYILKNKIYVLFGIIMFLIVRCVSSILQVSWYTLVIEIIVGIFVYMLLCIVYWKSTDQAEWLNMLKKLLGRDRND